MKIEITDIPKSIAGRRPGISKYDPIIEAIKSNPGKAVSVLLADLPATFQISPHAMLAQLKSARGMRIRTGKRGDVILFWMDGEAIPVRIPS